MTTALNLVTNAAGPQSAASKVVAFNSSDDGNSPSFSQVLAGSQQQSENDAAQQPQTSASPDVTQPSSQQSANTTSGDNSPPQGGSQLTAGQSAKSSIDKKIHTESSDDKDKTTDDQAESVSPALLTATITQQVLPTDQAQPAKTQQQAAAQDASTSLPQQALEIAAQVAAVQTQVANRQQGVAVQTASPKATATQAATSLIDTTPATPDVAGASSRTNAAMGTAKATDAAQTTVPSAQQPLNAAVATSTPQMPLGVQPVAANNQQTPQQAVRRTNTNGVNPMAQSAKQTARTNNDTQSSGSQSGTAASSSTALASPQQQAAQAAQPTTITTQPQHNNTGVTDSNLAVMAAAMSASTPQTPTSATSSQTPTITLNLNSTPVGSAQWNTDLGHQMVLLSSNMQNSSQTAQLRLDPPNLGPLHVTINLTDGVASAAFVSAHAAVRQALESAMPQLQTAFEQAGLSLGQTSVGEQGAQSGQQQANSQSGNFSNSDQQNSGDTVAAVLQVSATRNTNALVDTFA